MNATSNLVGSPQAAQTLLKDTIPNARNLQYARY